MRLFEWLFLLGCIAVMLAVEVVFFFVADGDAELKRLKGRICDWLDIERKVDK